MHEVSILPGNIYDCEVIFTDTLGSKTRPVIILSGPHEYMNINGGLYLICPITSTEIFPNCPSISNSDFENGGLKKPLSYLNVLKPAGVDFSQIKNYRGTLKSSKFTEIKRILVQKHSLL
jgi:mRNA-degrading endonuclease toxin of MazEF toxin-antitoxin module